MYYVSVKTFSSLGIKLGTTCQIHRRGHVASNQHRADNKRFQIIYELRVAFPSFLRSSVLNPIQNGNSLT